MDHAKVSAIAKWPAATSRKEVQHILGFANFYRCFMQISCSVAAPLHALTSLNAKFQWSPNEDSAFQKLELSVTSAPILVLPGP